MLVRLYTDGSCISHDTKRGGPGGWAYVFTDESDEPGEVVSSMKHNTTSTNVEILAATAGLNAAEAGSVVYLYTDCLTIPDILQVPLGPAGPSRGIRECKPRSAEQRHIWTALAVAAGRHDEVVVVYLDKRARRLDCHRAHDLVHRAARHAAHGLNGRVERRTHAPKDQDWVTTEDSRRVRRNSRREMPRVNAAPPDWILKLRQFGVVAGSEVLAERDARLAG